MRTLLFVLSLLTRPLFSQENDSLSKVVSKKIVGKWTQSKIVGEKFPKHDKIIFNEDKTYTWAKSDQNKKESGRWKIDNYTDLTTKQFFELLDLENPDGKSNGAIYIYKVTEKLLILRTFSIVGESTENNFIDLYFKKE